MRSAAWRAARRAMVALWAAALWCGAANAQTQPPNTPPPGAYQPIPNFSGPGAGLLFRRAINDRFSGAMPISPAIVRLPLENLPAAFDGLVFYCTDCRRTNPCAAGGTGAWALGTRGEWRCAEGPLEQNLEAAGTKVINLGAGTAANDALGFGQSNAQLRDLDDTGATDGSNEVAHFSVNKVRNVRAYGAVASITTAQAATSSGNANITLDAVGDFKVGQAVKVSRAAGAPDVSTPTGLTLDRRSYNNNPNPTADGDISGQCRTVGWDFGTTGTSNANCTTTRRYQVAAIDASGGWSAPTSVVEITNAADTLHYDNSVRVTWNNTTNAVAYAVYACKGAACTPTLKAVVPHLPQESPQLYRDASDQDVHAFAADAEFSGAVQGSAKNKDLLTTITAISGTTVTLATAPSQTGTFTMRHDDGPAFNSAISGLCTTGGEIEVPSGNYQVATTISLLDCRGIRIRGSGYGGYGSVQSAKVTWVGHLGGRVFNLTNSNGNVVENVSVRGDVNSPGIAFDLDRVTPVNITPSNNHLRDIWIIRAGVGVAVAKTSTSNNELHKFTNVFIHTDGNFKGNYTGWYIRGGWQTNYLSIHGGNTASCIVGFDLNAPGSMLISDHNFGSPTIWGVRAQSLAKPLELRNIQAESGGLFWYGPGAGSGQPVVISNSEIACKTGLSGYCISQTGTGNFHMTNTFVGCDSRRPCKVGLNNLNDQAHFLINNLFDDHEPLTNQSGDNSIAFAGQYAAQGNKTRGNSSLPLQRGRQELINVYGGRNPTWHNKGLNSIKTKAIATPGAPTVTVEGTAGSTTADYRLVCEDGSGSFSDPSPVTQITNAPNTLDTTNRVRISVPNNDNQRPYALCHVLKNGISGSVLLGTTCSSRECNYTDTGQSLTSFTSPSRNETADVIIDGGLKVGGSGQALLLKRFSSTYSLNLAAPGAVPGCVDSAAQTLTGVALGNVCTASMNANMQAAQQMTCFVNAADQVTFRVCQFSGAAADPDGGGATYRAVVEQY